MTDACPRNHETFEIKDKNSMFQDSILWSGETKVRIFTWNGIHRIWRCHDKAFDDDCLETTFETSGINDIHWQWRTVQIWRRQCLQTYKCY